MLEVLILELIPKKQLVDENWQIWPSIRQTCQTIYTPKFSHTWYSSVNTR